MIPSLDRTMVRVVVAARPNRVSPALPVIVADGLNGYSLGGDGRRPPCHQTLLAAVLDHAINFVGKWHQETVEILLL